MNAYGPCFPAKVDPAWIERLKRRQADIEQLCRGIRATFGPRPAIEWAGEPQKPNSGVEDICAAIQSLLGAEIAESLEAIANPPKLPPPTIEDLERAQRQVEQIQEQLDALDNLCDELPETQAEFIRTTNRPMIEGSLQNAQQWLSTVQSAIEQATAHPEAPNSAESLTQQKGETD